MRPLTLIAFGAGCLTSAFALAWMTADVRAQGSAGAPIPICVAADGVLRAAPATGSCRAGEARLSLLGGGATLENSAADGTRVAALEQRVKALEDETGKRTVNRVVAPFEVVSRTGQRMLYVEDGFVRLYNANGDEVALIAATNTGGSFAGKSASGALKVGVGAGERAGNANAGLVVIEDGVDRMSIGREGEGVFIARFFGKTGVRIAGIGQSSGGRGAAYVADTKGTVRAAMRIETDDTGFFAVNNAGGQTVASVTEDPAGGRLVISNSTGEMMVLAAVNPKGFGVVQAGPAAFKPGLGLLGLPGSYIAGKPK
jgi:hypothetical protein